MQGEKVVLRWSDTGWFQLLLVQRAFRWRPGPLQTTTGCKVGQDMCVWWVVHMGGLYAVPDSGYQCDQAEMRGAIRRLPTFLCTL
jgi:hypothetical protein